MRRAFLFYLLLLIGFAAFASDIAVVSLAVGSNYKKSVQAGLENKRLYCKIHGYDFICGEEVLDSSRPIPWSKIVLIQNVLAQSCYKWVFWTDADSLIMNLGIRLEEFIDEDYNLIIGKDYNAVNSGQFFIKNCPWSVQLLANIYAHTECINHPWWEQSALILEMEHNSSVRQLTKVVSQRQFNSYPSEIAGNLTPALYQPGDFILHFPSIRDLDALFELMCKYSGAVLNYSEFSNVDFYLQKRGYCLSPQHSERNEGYMTALQKKQFICWLQSHPGIKKIAEIGLNGGHSAEVFFQNCCDLQKFLSFDIQKHSYTNAAQEYLEKRYKGRFIFIPGDSAVTVPRYARNAPDAQCDLIYIDGNHSYWGALTDILNCHLLAHENTVLWIDDYNDLFIQKAVRTCENQGIVQVNKVHSSLDSCGKRVWAEARYVFH
ncbi:MAG TPA: class I SAM-dependent methyltransferase [Rhabdochlamydiaceae bacterium]|jgi:hypothetical protein